MTLRRCTRKRFTTRAPADAEEYQALANGGGSNKQKRCKIFAKGHYYQKKHITAFYSERCSSKRTPQGVLVQLVCVGESQLGYARGVCNMAGREILGKSLT